MDFYAGSVVRVDLTLGRVQIEPLRPDWMLLYVGGKGLMLRYLYEELAPGTRPLARENPLLVFTGPFAGTTAPTCSRIVVGCLSPLTGAVLDSYAGGSFGPELKFAGYDGIVITGKSPQPVVLAIDDRSVQLLPAERYRGLQTSAVEGALRRDLDPQAKVLSTGPAGESGLPWSCLSTDQYHKAGRGGAGAVMGSKNLKAIAVRGRGSVHVPDARGFLEETRRLQAEHLFTDDNMWACEEGTPALVEPVFGAGALPIRNFTEGTLSGVEGVSSAALLARRVKIRACTQCGLACRQFHQFGQVRSEGPEFETIALCGANCGVVDLDALSRFNWTATSSAWTRCRPAPSSLWRWICSGAGSRISG